MSDILKFDRQHLWHPYTSLTNPQEMLEVAGAHGCTLTLADGTELTDGTASWWSAIQGYNQPELNQVIVDQLGDFAHVMFGGLTHKPAVELGQRLLEITSPNLDAIFYSDSGSVSVEVGLKMALQYWQGVGKPGKTDSSHFEPVTTVTLSPRCLFPIPATACTRVLAAFFTSRSLLIGPLRV